MNPSRKSSKSTYAEILKVVLAIFAVCMVLNLSACVPLPTVTPNTAAVTEPPSAAPVTEPAVVTESPAVATVTDTPAVVTPVSGLETIPMQIGYGYRGSWFELYFIDPTNPAASTRTGGPDVPLAGAINQARVSVDMAAYSLSLPSVRDALVAAYRNGVTVRVVMESDNMDGTAPQALVEAGIPVIGDRREGLMHDKFIVIDRSEVWMGSMNFTNSGTYEDNNNLFRIRSTRIAENYTKEFEEMFVDDKFGPDTVPATPNPVITMDGTTVENYFSPDDKVARRIKELLNGAEQSIYFMAYSFTSDEFGQILLQKAADGKTVKGVFETEQYNSGKQYCEYDSFRAAGLDVHLDGNPGLLHHKVFIIDGKIVIFGSYNFSTNAEKTNDENVIIVFNPDIAAQFMAEYQRVSAVAQP